MIDRREALNEMLGAVSQRIVTSVDSLHPVALEADAVLSQIDKNFQAEGWSFNRSEVTLSPVVSSGNILLPNDFLEVDPVDVDSDLIVRAGKLFDPVENTYNIGVDVEVFLTVQLDIGDMPHAAASYMTALATEKFYANRKGDRAGMEAQARTATRRLYKFQQSEARKKDHNVFNAPQKQRLLHRIGKVGRIGRNPNRVGG